MPSAHHEFLTQQGASFAKDGSLQHFGSPFENAFAYCHHLSVLTIIGEDAATFLQGQLTCDIREVEQNEPRFGAHLNLQGRVLFALWVIPTPAKNGFRLIVPTAMVADVQEHWAKYLMFSRSTLSVEQELVVLMAPQSHGEPLTQHLKLASEALSHNDTWQHFAALGNHYFITHTKALEAVWPELLTFGTIGGEPQAHWWDIAAGLAQIYPGAHQAFLPQVLNYDLFQGISFNKGCYTGQEVVARMKFKGQLKQRLHHISWPEAVAAAPGDTLRNEQGRALGQVVVSLEYQGKLHALVVLRRDHDLPQQLNDTPITPSLEALPYPLPEPGK